MTHVDQVMELISDRYGLMMKNRYRNTLNQALEEMSTAQNRSQRDIVSSLLGNDSILRDLAGYLTVGESFFYRHEEQLDELLQGVRNQIRERSHLGPIVIWSAGCADGQEPYSVAIACTENLTPFEQEQVKIVATDLNPRAIERAERACYNDWSFRGFSDDLKRRYFKSTDDNQLQLKDYLRSRVQFTCASVQDQTFRLGDDSVDFLLFRNVAIYIENKDQEEMYRRFSYLLRPGGRLFISPSDPIPPSSVFRRSNESSTAIYCRVPKGSSTAPSVSDTDGHQATEEMELPVIFHLAHEDRPSQSGKGSLASVVSSEAAVAVTPGPSSPAPLSPDEDPIDHLACGQRYLEQDRLEQAETEFRHAVFLNPQDPLARFWYAMSLMRNGVPNRSLVQIRQLFSALNQMAPEAVLSDGKTTAGELIQAVTQLQERLI